MSEIEENVQPESNHDPRNTTSQVKLPMPLSHPDAPEGMEARKTTHQVINPVLSQTSIQTVSAATPPPVQGGSYVELESSEDAEETHEELPHLVNSHTSYYPEPAKKSIVPMLLGSLGGLGIVALSVGLILAFTSESDEDRASSSDTTGSDAVAVVETTSPEPPKPTPDVHQEISPNLDNPSNNLKVKNGDIVNVQGIMRSYSYKRGTKTTVIEIQRERDGQIVKCLSHGVTKYKNKYRLEKSSLGKMILIRGTVKKNPMAPGGYEVIFSNFKVIK